MLTCGGSSAWKNVSVQVPLDKKTIQKQQKWAKEMASEELLPLTPTRRVVVAFSANFPSLHAEHEKHIESLHSRVVFLHYIPEAFHMAQSFAHFFPPSVMCCHLAGQFLCGNKRCEKQDGLKSWEVNFAYVEQGEKRNALVKLRKFQRSIFMFFSKSRLLIIVLRVWYSRKSC